MRWVIASGVLSVVPASVAFAAELTPPSEAISGPAWSPYIGGALIGVLTWLTMLFCKKPVGASSSYATAAGLLGRAAAPRHTLSLKYFQEHPPQISWELVFIGASVAGAFLAAWQGGELTQRWLPPLWAERFGADSIGWRALAAFGGGTLMAFGARLAGGCTSGHGISGTAQLSMASWVSLLCFFAGGVAVANLLFRL